MGETRQQLKERLQAAGVWDDYLALRDRLAKDGLTPAQAREEALRQVESRPTTPSQDELPDDEHPADPSPGEGQEAAAVDGGQPDFGRQVPNFQAAQWVAQNLANAKVRPDEAPSGLAWGLLTWVRRTPANQATFWGSIWSKMLPTGAAIKKQQGETGAASEADEGTALCQDLVTNLLDQFEAEQAQKDAAFAARPDAARVGHTLQVRLAEALQREEGLRKRLALLEGGKRSPSGGYA
jgi:hypothetical protein